MKASSTHDVVNLYDQTADSYASMMDAEIELPVYADVLGRLAKRLKGIDGPVIDTSCGPGHVLLRYRERYDPQRSVVAIDLSPRMVELAAARLGSTATARVGDMRNLSDVTADSSAAVLSFFAVHHLDEADVQVSFREWNRVLEAAGQLVVAAWEGRGPIDYGEHSDVVAFRYTKDDLLRWAEGAGFTVDRCSVEPVDGFPMDAVYLEGTKTAS